MYLQFHYSTAFLLFFTIILTSCSPPMMPDFNAYGCSESTEELASDSSNLDAVLNSLSLSASVNMSFDNVTSNGVYGLFLCRGDIPSHLCQICIENATQTLQQNCITYKIAIVWYDMCMLRYSNESFFGELNTDLGAMIWNNKNTSSPNDNDPVAMELVYGLINTVPQSNLLFGYSSKTDRYAMAQCTKDINNSNCELCLQTLMDDKYYYPSCCKGKVGWQLFSASCSMRYEAYPFYYLPALSPSPSPSPSSMGSTVPQDSVLVNVGNAENAKKGNNTIIIVVAAIGVSLSAIVAALLGFWCYNKRRKSSKDNPACRPTMSEVVQMLGSKSLNLPQPTTPPYTVDKFISFSGWSSVSSTGTGTRTKTGTGSLTTDKSTSEF
ncbi:hypothetical protein ACFE04_001540 [Oxalis oulophora]